MAAVGSHKRKRPVLRVRIPKLLRSMLNKELSMEVSAYPTGSDFRKIDKAVSRKAAKEEREAQAALADLEAAMDALQKEEKEEAEAMEQADRALAELDSLIKRLLEEEDEEKLNQIRGMIEKMQRRASKEEMEAFQEELEADLALEDLEGTMARVKKEEEQAEEIRKLMVQLDGLKAKAAMELRSY